MTAPASRPGLFVSVDGPGGVGKSTVVALVAQELRTHGLPVHATTQPSRTPLGDHIRHGTHTYRGMALACLVTGDRHHQLTAEILPALRHGNVVICDRYLPSSLVLQRLDGLTPRTVWELNAGIATPDLSLILSTDPAIIADRLHSRGGHSRFEQRPDASTAEVRLYHQAAVELADAGWPLLTLDATHPPETIADTVVHQIMTLYLERSPACPA
ncbi:dTMP kinase [Actinophytocola sp.]|uniref:dTMP kinase n=1 Tax=Actinophytocola sp. TaxID=1872138 RepID=UPI003D6BC9EE